MKGGKSFLHWNISILFVIGLGSGIHLLVQGYVLERNITVYEHESFMNYMVVTPHTNLTSCTLQFNNITIELDPHLSTYSVASDLYSLVDEEIIGHLSNLGEGLCGLKYENATQIIDKLRWRLAATDDEGRLFEGNFTTTIASRSNRDKKIEVALGERFSIECVNQYEGDGDASSFCYLLNPAGETVDLAKCEYNSLYFKMDDVGTWQCYVGSLYSTEAIQYKVELINKKAEEPVITWGNETDHYVNIGCQLQGFNDNVGIKSCKMTAPNLQIFNVKEFSATDRYHALETNYKTARCSMQIQKPLLEFEKGMWLCEIITREGSSTGGFIEINKTEDINYPKQLKVVTRLGQHFKVSCQVPYSSEFCSITAPDGTLYLNQSQFVPELGRCSLTVIYATSLNAGTWICSFAQKTGVSDDIIRTEVSIVEPLATNATKVGEIGETTELMCHSNGYPLKYCRFTDPAGKTYHIHNHENSTSISYYGRGLEYGDCGIKISNTQGTDYGDWICTVRLIGANSDLSASVEL